MLLDHNIKCSSKNCRQKKSLRSTDLFHKVPASIRQINTLSPVPYTINAGYLLPLIILGTEKQSKTFQSTERLLVLIS